MGVSHHQDAPMRHSHIRRSLCSQHYRHRRQWQNPRQPQKHPWSLSRSSCRLSLPGVKVNGAELSMSSSLILLSATVTAASFVVTFVNVRLVSLTAAENQSLVAVSAKAEPDAHAIAHATIPKTFSAFIYSSLKGLTAHIIPPNGGNRQGGILIFFKFFLCPFQPHWNTSNP